MNALSSTSYFHLVSKFLEALSPAVSSDAFDEEEGLLEFTAGNLIVRMFPHVINEENPTEPNALVLEADLMLLDLDNRDVNHDRFLILHQLNALSRLSTGIVAFITEEGMLSIGKVLNLASLDEEKLANEVAAVMEAGNNLYEGWNHLADLAHASNDNEQTEESDATVNQSSFSINQVA